LFGFLAPGVSVLSPPNSVRLAASRCVAIPADVAGPVRVRLSLAGQRDRGAVEREIRLGR
jgi:hypothetical protein